MGLKFNVTEVDSTKKVKSYKNKKKDYLLLLSG